MGNNLSLSVESYTVAAFCSRSCKVYPIAASLLILPALAAANTPIGELWVLGAPVFLAWEGLLWLFVAITVIEGVVLSVCLRVPLAKGLGLALVINIVSSLAGAFIYLTKGCIVLAVILLIPASDIFRKRLRIKFIAFLIPIGYFVIVLSTFLMIDSASRIFGSLDIRTRLLALVPAFIVSTLIEFLVHALVDRQTSPIRLLTVWTIANGVSYPLLALMFILNPLPDYMSPGANTWTVVRDIEIALDRGDLDRASAHAETLGAIVRREPDRPYYFHESTLKFARALHAQGKHRQALVALANFPPPEDSKLRPSFDLLHRQVLDELGRNQ